VVFESAKRLEMTLTELEHALGNRSAVLMRELTKLHEEVRPGSLRELQEWAETSQLRGEVVLVIAGAGEESTPVDDVELVLRTLRQSGLSASQAAREAAAMTGLPRSELYQLALRVVEATSVGLEGELAPSDKDALQDPLGDEEGPER
jgi:16S rRNA (cytidine1402-2'-O)-methyltransferase